MSIGPQDRRKKRIDGTSDADAGTGTGKRIARFCLLFALYNVVLGLLTSTDAAIRYLHGPVSRCFAFLSMIILGAFGKSSVLGVDLEYNGFRVQIVEACDGVLPAVIYLSSVLAFPSRWIDRCRGISIGLPAIFLINLARVITLMIVGATWPDLFEQVHIYVWQALVIALTMGVWVVWAERFAQARLGTRS